MELTSEEQLELEVRRISSLSPQHFMDIFNQLLKPQIQPQVVIENISSLSLQQYMQILFQLISLPNLSTQFGQSIAISMMAIISNMPRNYFGRCFKWLFDIIANFNIEPRWKKAMLRLVNQFVQKYRLETEGILANLVSSLTFQLQNLMDQNIQQNVVVVKQIDVNCLNEVYQVRFQYPCQVRSVIETMLLLGQIFIQLGYQTTEEYVQLSEIYQIVNKMVFREQFVVENTHLADKVLELWIELINQLTGQQGYEMKFVGVLDLIVSNSEFNYQINMILNLAGSGIQFGQSQLPIFNYLDIPQIEERNDLLSLKRKTAKVYCNFLKACNVESWKNNMGYLEGMFWSLNRTFREEEYTFEFMEQNYDFIELWAILIDKRVIELEQTQKISILMNPVLPLFDVQMSRLRLQFYSDYQDLLLDLDDIIHPRKRMTVISILQYLVDSLVSGQTVIIFLVELCKISIEISHLPNSQDMRVQQLPQFKKISVQSTLMLFFMLVQDQQIFVKYPETKQYFSSEKLVSYDDYQRSIAFYILSYLVNGQTFNEQIHKIIDVALSCPAANSPLVHFSLDLLFNISIESYSSENIHKYISLFKNFQSNSKSFSILQTIFNEKELTVELADILSLITYFKSYVRQRLQQKGKNKQTNGKFLGGNIIQIIFACKTLASNKTFCMKNSQVTSALFDLYLTIGQYEQELISENNIALGSKLLLCYKTLPNEFRKAMQFFDDTFRSQQYQNLGCYVYLFTAMEKCLPIHSQNINKIGQSICEPFYYFIYFPDGLNALYTSNLEDLSYCCLLLQIYLKKFYPMVKKHVVKQIKQATFGLWSTLKQFGSQEQLPLKARTVNLCLLISDLEKQQIMQPTWKDIIFLAQKKAFIDYDCCFLVSMIHSKYFNCKIEDKIQLMVLLTCLMKHQDFLVNQSQEKTKKSGFSTYYTLFYQINFKCGNWEKPIYHIAYFLKTVRSKDANFLELLQKLVPQQYQNIQEIFKMVDQLIVSLEPSTKIYIRIQNLQNRQQLEQLGKPHVRKTLKRQRSSQNGENSEEEGLQFPRRKFESSKQSITQALDRLSIEKKNQQKQ